MLSIQDVKFIIMFIQESLSKEKKNACELSNVDWMYLTVGANKMFT